MMTYTERMSAKVGADIDGTLLDYGHPWDTPTPHRLNTALCESLAKQGVTALHLISNQGGVPLAARGAPGLPTPAQAAERITFLIDSLAAYRIQIASLRICVWHEKADERDIRVARCALEEYFRWPIRFLYLVYDHSYWRKPNPAMLQVAGISTYYGDSDDDRAAAIAAGCQYIPIPRFTGQ